MSNTSCSVMLCMLYFYLAEKLSGHLTERFLNAWHHFFKKEECKREKINKRQDRTEREGWDMVWSGKGREGKGKERKTFSRPLKIDSGFRQGTPSTLS